MTVIKPVTPKRTTVAGRVPSTTDLVPAELAVNFTDKLLFGRDPSTGQVKALGNAGKRLFCQETSPINPNLGDEWYVPSTNTLYKYVNDGTVSNWSNVNTLAGAQAGGGATVISNPVITGAETASIGQSSTYTLSANPLLNNSSIATFTVTFNGLAPQTVNAVSNSATVSHTWTGTAGASENITVFATNNYGNNSALVTKIVTLVQTTVNTPSIISPLSGSTNVSTGTNLTGSAFASSPADTHAMSDWQVATDSGFSNIVFQSLNDATNKTSVVVTGLSNNVTYYARVRYKGTNIGWSAYSATISFTTANLYVDDVFSTYLYTGNGATQTINNGIDLAGKGGMVWIKNRTTVSSNQLFDTVRGKSGNSGYRLSTDINSAQSLSPSGFYSFNNSGFTLTSNELELNNSSSQNYTSWTFRRAPKFFDVVTYTGDGTSNRVITHSLGADVGTAIVKATSTTSNWFVRHRSATGQLSLNLTSAQAASYTEITAISSTGVTVSASANTNGVSYVMYVFAHDPSEDGIIQCGGYGHTYNNTTEVTLGWEPQYVLLKMNSATSDWVIYDMARGMPVAGLRLQLLANAGTQDNSVAPPAGIYPTATGFVVDTDGFNTGTYIYLAIRRPNKPPTSGTQVFQPVSTNVSAAPTTINTNFPVDLAINTARGNGYAKYFVDRLRGQHQYITSNNNQVEQSGTFWYLDSSNTFKDNNIGTGQVSMNYLFKRAPGFMDVVCYTGKGVAGRSLQHDLKAEPELIFYKSRANAYDWLVYAKPLGISFYLSLNKTDAKTASIIGLWNGVAPTNTSFTVGNDPKSNYSGYTYVAYLFASLPGVSKVGSYTGNGSNLNVDCGFAAGARFVMVKRTDNTGDWFIWDTARGIVTANDPHLSFNTTAAEVTTDDSIDPLNAGFTVSQNTATNINVTGATYIYLAIA